MKIIIWGLLLTGLVFLYSCNTADGKKALDDGETLPPKEDPVVPVNYDFENLQLYLNTSINSSISSSDWRWDHLASENERPDPTGVEYYYYVKEDYPTFLYNNKTTWPSISIKADKNVITACSVKVIFQLPDQKQATIAALLDSLTTFNLLKEEAIKTAIIETGVYRHSSETTIEEIVLELAEAEDEYDRIHYRIKNKAHNP